MYAWAILSLRSILPSVVLQSRQSRPRMHPGPEKRSLAELVARDR